MLRGSKICSASTATINGKRVKIIDTPGFFDGFKSTEDNFKELSKVLTLAKDGIHAVAFVMGQYTTSCEEAIKQLLGVQPFVFALLTHVENEGIDEVTTGKYIEECLSSPDCPPGFIKLMDMVEKRVIMLESVGFVANDYHEQKRQELVAMIEHVFTVNGSRMYTNVMLQHTAEVYEKARLQQETDIRETKEKLALNIEKVNHLKQQTDNTITGSEKNNTEIVALEEENEILENMLKKFTDGQYLEHLTEQILQDEMVKSNIKSNNMSGFMSLFTAYLKKSAFATTASAAYFGTIGGGIGAFAGSMVPGLGTAAGAYAGAQIGGLFGGATSFGLGTVGTVAKAYDECKHQ